MLIPESYEQGHISGRGGSSRSISESKIPEKVSSKIFILQVKPVVLILSVSFILVDFPKYDEK